MFPSHVASAWIGNSVQVATKHYLQITDEHFKQAMSSSGALHNPVQQPRAAGGSEAQAVRGDIAEVECLQQFAEERNPLQSQGVTRKWAILDSNQ